MAIPFHDAEDVARMGSVAYLAVAEQGADGREILGALFFTNSRGEPLEFCFNRLAVRGPEMWREDSIRHGAIRRLSLTLLARAKLEPRLLVCELPLAGAIFGDGSISVTTPVVIPCLSDPDSDFLSDFERRRHPSPHESQCLLVKSVGAGTFDELLNLIVERGLLFEPFQRARKGLDIAYRSAEPAQGAEC